MSEKVAEKVVDVDCVAESINTAPTARLLVGPEVIVMGAVIMIDTVEETVALPAASTQRA